MENINYIWIFYLIIINICFWALIFWNNEIFYLWLLNFILISIYLFYKEIKEFFWIIKDKFINLSKINLNLPNINSLYFQSPNYNLNIFKNIFTEFYILIKNYFKHWFFLFLVFLLIFSLFDNIFVKNFSLNSYIIWMICWLWLILLKKELFNWEIYFLNKLITLKDLLFLFSIELIYIFYFIFDWFKILDKLLFSFLLSWIFFVFSIYFFDLTKFRPIYRQRSVYFFLSIIIFLSVIFFYSNFDNIKQIVNLNKSIISHTNQINEDWQNDLDNVDDDLINNQTDNINKQNWNIDNLDIFNNQNWTGVKNDNIEKKIDLENNQLENLNQLESEKINDDINEDEEFINYLKTLLEEDEILNIEKKNLNVNFKQTDKIILKDIIPYLFKKNNIVYTWIQNINFLWVDKNSENYKYFLWAKYYWLIWNNTDLKINVRCKNYIVFLWLLQKRKIDYKNIFDDFRDYADKNWFIPESCKNNKEKIMFWWDLE